MKLESSIGERVLVFARTKDALRARLNGYPPPAGIRKLLLEALALQRTAAEG